MPANSDQTSLPAQLDLCESARSDLARRSTLLGLIAWLSVCLIATALFPEAVRQLNRLWMMSGLVGLVSAVALSQIVARDHQKNLELLAQLQRESCTDALTGVANRRVLDAGLQRFMQYCQAERRPLCLMMVDIDYFKTLNDTYGHSIGDDVLRKTGQTLSAFVRSTDLVSRYGGEEFVVVTPGVDLTTARELSERIRLAVQRQPLPPETGDDEVTISIGLTAMEADDVPATLLQRADHALYYAKHAGRNCTFCYVDGIYLGVTPSRDSEPDDHGPFFSPETDWPQALQHASAAFWGSTGTLPLPAVSQ